VALARGHGYLKEPVARTSIQTRPEFNTQQPYWWDNHGVWCGNVDQDTRYSTCGRCGDSPGQTSANQGGIYDKGVIVATYQSGSVFTIEAVFQAAHRGHFEVELCPQEQETDNCFQKLQIRSASENVRDGNRVCIPYDNNAPGPITAAVQLPAGVRCNRCTIRWTYRISYPNHCPQSPCDWSTDADCCDNPCPAQTFRNCADVRIV